MTDWRSQYENAADEEAARFARATDRALVEAIRSGATGQYYTVWRAIAARRATPEICWLLHDVLHSNRPYLDRYHCAAALLQLLRCTVFEAVELSAAWPVVSENLARMRGIIESSVGPPAR